MASLRRRKEPSLTALKQKLTRQQGLRLARSSKPSLTVGLLLGSAVGRKAGLTDEKLLALFRQ